MNFWGFVAEVFRVLNDTVNAIFASLVTAAVAGRLAWHTRLVQKGERNFFGKEMVFEGITVLFLFYVSQSAIAGVAAFLNLPDEVTAAIAPGVAAVIAYFGPGGIQAGLVAVWNWWSRKNA
ncbi:hypothetical protein [Parvibaculum sp.]|uniref:hypothetical protein n=1 Tax=Parvibaculum sp. TaxID=2024848 RepID=UPI00391BC499